MRSRRQRSQAVVEFGIIALVFTLLMFAVVDFGLLLNTWVRLSSATREIARAATVGYWKDDLQRMSDALVLPGISRTMYGPFARYCCGLDLATNLASNDKIVLTVTYYDVGAHCIPGAVGCTPLNAATTVDNHFWGGGLNCGTWPVPCGYHPLRGDIIVVSIVAPGMEVLTPLVRPFFGCAGSDAHCNVRLGSTAMMRYEGQ